ncbi:YoaK family protein [Actinomadura sp. 7K507]|uniref:YoaK family protein n=1 Tax=Actinomadura sp. 7K507 TaxID=2530365 RepID=UPI00104CB27F|nr:YoaK family protein [Actinomadura sp. 7K507]TDC88525.1 DUF1275 domain-containing protein [Actinomadura sp. 7K507]
MGAHPPSRPTALARMADDRVHLRLMMALTFTTGMVDAIGFLGLDRVFVGNMTGNVVILGMAVVGTDDFPVVGPALALIGFLLGAAHGGRVLRGAPPGWSGRVTSSLGTVAAITLVLGVAVLAADHLPEPLTIATTSLLGAAMGLQAAVARHIGVAEVTTVVVTSTLTALASQSRIAGGTGERGGRRALAAVLILAGAAAGAVLLRAGAGAGLLVAGAIMAAVAAVGAAHARAVRSGPLPSSAPVQAEPTT